MSSLKPLVSAVGLAANALKRAAPAISTSAEAYDLARAKPAVKSAMLEAVAICEATFKFARPALRNDPAFVTQAAIRNPALLVPEWQDQYVAKTLADSIKPAIRAQALAHPEVAKAIDVYRTLLSKAPDLKPEGFSDNRPLLTTLIQNRLTAAIKDARPTAVVALPKDDWNGQFSEIETLRSLTKNYKVMAYRVATDVEFATAVKESTVTKPADFLLIGGHGEKQLTAFGADDPARLPAAARVVDYANLKSVSKYSAALAKANEEKYIDLSDKAQLAPLKASLGDGADIVLLSCSTGKGGANARNLAHFLHNLFPQTRLHAPTEPVPNAGLVLDATGKFKTTPFEEMGKGLLLEPVSTAKPKSRGWAPVS